jgi:hypothetical protein
VSRFLCLSFFAAAKKVSAAPHRGNANRPLTQQGKAKEKARPRKGQNHKTTTNKAPRRQKNRGYKTLAISDKTIESTSVDINGNGYSRPKSRNVTSPGIRPIPIFLSHGQQADNTATAINVVNSQRIIANP